MKALDILKTARELLSDPNHWTKGAFARDANAATTLSVGSSAVCWCAEGALIKAYDVSLRGRQSLPDHWAAAAEATYALERVIPQAKLDAYNRAGVAPINAYNDAKDMHHSDLLAWFDRAIESVSK